MLKELKKILKKEEKYTVILKSIGVKYEAKGNTVLSALEGLAKQDIKGFLKFRSVFTVQTKGKEVYAPMTLIIRVQQYKFGTQHALEFLANILEDKLKRA